MIKLSTRAQIKGYLEGFLQGMIHEVIDEDFNPRELRAIRKYSKQGDLKPFHESLLPAGILKISEFERSFSTKLGSVFEECARLIALDNHKFAQRGYRVKGEISADAIKKIEEIINKIGRDGMRVSYSSLVNQIINTSQNDIHQERECISDLYILQHDGTEIFIEIKSPKPNKGQCLEATNRLLQIHGIKSKNHNLIKTFYAMAYNPYGFNKENYKHSFVLNYMDIGNQVLIGEEFWELVGGKGTYDEILDIFREVGAEKGTDIFDQLALKY